MHPKGLAALGLLTSIVGGVQKGSITERLIQMGLLTSIVGGVQKMVCSTTSAVSWFADLDCWRCAKEHDPHEPDDEWFADLDCWRCAKVGWLNYWVKGRFADLDCWRCAKVFRA